MKSLVNLPVSVMEQEIHKSEIFQIKHLIFNFAQLPRDLSYIQPNYPNKKGNSSYNLSLR